MLYRLSHSDKKLGVPYGAIEVQGENLIQKAKCEDTIAITNT